MILGIPYILIFALAVFMVSTVLVTEFLKRWINIEPLLLSWITGGLIYGLIYTWVPEAREISLFKSVIVFIVITASLNTSYSQFRWLKEMARKWVGSKLI